ncbi:MAG: MarR family winged helix-turn-helix transcriptional regulator [Archangium sp.]
MVSLRRLFQRKELAQLWASAFGRHSRLDYTELRLLDAVRSGAATVGDVGRVLGVDASRASRQVASAVKKGLVRRHAEQNDARKVVLEVTAAGQRIAEKGSQLTRDRIALALDGWSATERQRFAADLEKFVRAFSPS